MGDLLPRPLRLVKAAGSESGAGDGRMAKLGAVPWGDPLFAPFSGRGREGLIGARFQRYMLVEGGTRADGSEVVFASRGTNPSVSANGTADGVVWTIRLNGVNEYNQAEFDDPALPHQVTPAVLYAFDAATLELLWASDDPARGGTTLGDRIKFTTPTVANGKVFVGTGLSPDRQHPGELNVFGVRDL